ncbi:hypothetical protein V495_06964 [Pseudogymnoascus sp. VKM F-4514 (FW-929)]|nr:hypothetical protein V495_06964 [Pseudogymnoascus sp. VKM F-4514 (FW-929)]KFY58238.1 hypothetical protein V497_04955 [Pseudogymnoascus sp. VKM F-4516 (FW-969)]
MAPNSSNSIPDTTNASDVPDDQAKVKRSAKRAMEAFGKLTEANRRHSQGNSEAKQADDERDETKRRVVQAGDRLEQLAHQHDSADGAIEEAVCEVRDSAAQYSQAYSAFAKALGRLEQAADRVTQAKDEVIQVCCQYHELCSQLGDRLVAEGEPYFRERAFRDDIIYNVVTKYKENGNRDGFFELLTTLGTRYNDLHGVSMPVNV